MFHPTLSKTGRFLFAPVIRFCEYLGEHHPVTMVQLRYFAAYKRFCELKTPKDLNEKILYTKLFTDTSSWPALVDKYRVREYVQKCGLGHTLVKLYGAWSSLSEMNWNALPEDFILKANNGDGKGTNKVVRGKSALSEQEIGNLTAMMSDWLSRKHVGALVAEPQYADIQPCVIAEELLPVEEGQNTITDYKVWCFNGKAHFIWVCSDRSKGGNSAAVLTYDREWMPHPEYSVFTSDYVQGEPIPRPSNLEEMLSIAETLSEGFPYLRVDLYNINGKVYFGELTFTSQGGINTFFTKEFLDYTGSFFDVENLPRKHK